LVPGFALESRNVLLGVEVHTVASVASDEWRYELGMVRLPLPTANIQITFENLLAYALREDDWVAALAIDERVQNLTGLRAFFEGANQIGHVLCVQQGLIRKRHNHGIELAAERG
jgi:hypothetical protein